MPVCCCKRELSPISAEPKDYSKALLVFGNVVIALWIVLGAVSCWFFNPVVGWVFLVLALMLLFGVLRRLGCNSCYHCKSCTMGFGKLSDLFFGDGCMVGVKSSNVLKFIYVYGLLGMVPTAFLAVSIMQEFTASKIAVLVLLLLLLFYSGSRKKRCDKTVIV